MPQYRVRIGEGGMISIPAVLRRKHGFKVGETLVLEEAATGVILCSLDEAVAGARSIKDKMAAAQKRFADELIAEERPRKPRK
jgi:bifunctional DNA-binding transcriptional regulator/antitoxin component of YhaV-PrlF toxin-antitoxin module